MIFNMFYITVHSQKWRHTHSQADIWNAISRNSLSLCLPNASVFYSVSFEMLLTNDYIDILSPWHVAVCSLCDTAVEVGTSYAFLWINSHTLWFSKQLLYCLPFFIPSSGQYYLSDGSRLPRTQLKSWRCKQREDWNSESPGLTHQKNKLSTQTFWEQMGGYATMRRKGWKHC